jgi:hypothetical protein
MLAPSFINASSSIAEAARTRMLLIRAGAVLLVSWWLPSLAGGLGELADELFVRYDPALSRPGEGGYPYLFLVRVADIEMWAWLRQHGDSVLSVGVGLGLFFHRYRGPRWGELPS